MSSRRGSVVLIVDDCANLRATLKFILREMASIHTVGAATFEEALRLTYRHKFDAVISDINRDGMDGLDFLAAFKRAHPKVPVIIASGALAPATARRARWLRAYDCLAKPFDCRELVEVVRAAVASKRVCRTLLLSARSRHDLLRSWQPGGGR